MCVTSKTRVCGVMAWRNRSTMSAADFGGTGNEIGLTTIPSRRARCSHDVIMPSFQLLYATGAAWTGDSSPRWTQNVGAGLLFALVSLSVYADPVDPKPRFVATAALPRVF